MPLETRTQRLAGLAADWNYYDSIDNDEVPVIGEEDRDELSYRIARQHGYCLLCGDPIARALEPELVTLALIEAAGRMETWLEQLDCKIKEDNAQRNPDVRINRLLSNLRRRTSLWCLWEACRSFFTPDVLNMLAVSAPWPEVREMDAVMTRPDNLEIFASISDLNFFTNWRKGLCRDATLPWWLDGTLDHLRVQKKASVT